MLGIFIGAAVSGIISDHFGRKKTIILFSTAMSIFSIAIAFANSMTTFIILRMLAALSSVGFWTTFFVYAMEMVGGKWKAILGIGFEFPWAVAYSILPGNNYNVH
jgi:SP family arabinose:H+ symporter-like MFS transporter